MGERNGLSKCFRILLLLADILDGDDIGVVGENYM